MQQRIITAIFFVALMLAGLLSGPYGFVVLLLVIAGVSLWELAGLVAPGLTYMRQWVTILPGIVLVGFGLYAGHRHLWSDVPGGSAWLALLWYVLLWKEMFRPRSGRRSATAVAWFGLWYVGLPYALLARLAWWRGSYDGLFVLGLLVLMWLNDTGAYFTGKFWGRHKLAPHISPKKTWEGLVGGVVAALLVSLVVARLVPAYSPATWMVLGGITALGILGDLFESQLKRRAGVKDSGRLMPGHGGVLDRFDAFMFVLPLIYLYFSIFGA